MASKRIEVTQGMIESYARGCSVNNPVVAALKEQGFPEAHEIIFHGDEIYVDGKLVTPTLPMIRWMNDWIAGRRVKPSILGYNESM